MFDDMMLKINAQLAGTGAFGTATFYFHLKFIILNSGCLYLGLIFANLQRNSREKSLEEKNGLLLEVFLAFHL